MTDTGTLVLTVLLAVVNLVVSAFVLYGQERVKNLARQATEKVLQANSADHQRRLTEFSLFIERRHQVYAALYARYRRAAGLAATLSDETNAPKFDYLPLELAEETMKRDGITEILRRSVREAYASGDKDAAARMLWLAQVTRLQMRANGAYMKAEELRASNDLYLSSQVSDQIFTTAQSIDATLESVATKEPNPETPSLVAAMKSEVVKLLNLMKTELQRGEALPISTD